MKEQNKSIGFVPTMGCLHEGHLSLVRESIHQNEISVVSIFVNPAQFAPGEDFQWYPRVLEKDIGILRREGVDYVFSPDSQEMYPAGFQTSVEVQDLQDKLCGKSRPGHFRGVCTVVLKLIHVVNPDVAYFGQKDAQQAVIIRKMLKDLDMDIKISVMPIVRDADGLALSSRNTYLNESQRKAALGLFQSLRAAQSLIRNGERQALKIIEKMESIILDKKMLKVDYIAVVHPETLESLTNIQEEALIAVAVYVDNIRLIDNIKVKIKESNE
jgi:pantoate--beta-alanine ligase